MCVLCYFCRQAQSVFISCSIMAFVASLPVAILEVNQNVPKRSGAPFLTSCRIQRSWCCFMAHHVAICWNGVSIFFFIHLSLFPLRYICNRSSAAFNDQWQFKKVMLHWCVFAHCVCIDLMGFPTHGVRESQMPNTSLTSVKTGDRGATHGKVTPNIPHSYWNGSSC